MNVFSVVISLLGSLYICNADSRLLLQTTVRDICASVRCPAGTKCQVTPASTPGIECAIISDYCEVDSDCAVKNVGNCCGYYPGCVNINHTPDLDAVRVQCQKMGMVSVCGWSNPSGCSCENNKCQVIHGTRLSMSAAAATKTNCDALPNEWTVVGTPRMCAVILYICEPGYTYWGNECGCGCKPDCLSLPSDYRIVGAPDECPLIRFACNVGEQYFMNDCGCGCKQITNPCAAMTCLRGTECVDNGDGTASCVPL